MGAYGRRPSTVLDVVDGYVHRILLDQTDLLGDQEASWLLDRRLGPILLQTCDVIEVEGPLKKHHRRLGW